MSARTVYVVDDEDAIRRSACLLLKVCGFAAQAFDGGRSFLNVHSSLEPGCILLDLRMPRPDGFAVQRLLRDQESLHETIVMTGHGDVASAVAALNGGAITFVEKPFSKAQLVPAIELALSKIDQPDRYQAQLLEARRQVDCLGPREKSVLALLAEANASDQIASLLGISPAEVDTSRALILQQFGVENIPAALTIAFAAYRAG